MTDNEIVKALDILAKFDFFGGQRAGRELWNEKPADVQDKDIENFSKDVAFLKDFFNRQKEEIERVRVEKDNLIRTYKECQIEAVKEFAEIIVADYPEMEYYLNELVKEFTEGNTDGK